MMCLDECAVFIHPSSHRCASICGGIAPYMATCTRQGHADAERCISLLHLCLVFEGADGCFRVGIRSFFTICTQEAPGVHPTWVQHGQQCGSSLHMGGYAVLRMAVLLGRLRGPSDGVSRAVKK